MRSALQNIIPPRATHGAGRRGLASKLIKRLAVCVCGLGLCLMSLPALSHSFGVVYTLPVPFWLYAWGATAALIASFLVVGFFVTAGENDGPPWSRDISNSWILRVAQRLRLLPIFKWLSFAALVLCIVTGLVGTQNAYDNINMTLFWVIFLLGFAYVTALVGNLYELVSPWQALVDVLTRWFPVFGKGLFVYPRRLAYWPALLFYMVLIWIELFANIRPFGLAVMLLIYSVINVVGACLFGEKNWFQYGEVFAVFFRLVAMMAPVEVRPGHEGQPGRVLLRLPFSGLTQSSVQHVSLLLFVLFMLSSTAFDGLHETRVWRGLFWRDLYLGVLQYHTSTNPLAAFPKMAELYRYWQTAWLLLSPVIYWLVYVLFIALTRRVTRSSLTPRSLALQFTLPLLPIALVYHISHYYTLLQSQGIKILALISDPFGLGQDWFGTANWYRGAIVPDVGTVWHVQVVLIVLGHIVGVYFAHKVAVKVFPSQKAAVISQLPMLVLMVLFTTAGLWILSQPLAG